MAPDWVVTKSKLEGAVFVHVVTEAARTQAWCLGRSHHGPTNIKIDDA